MKYSELKLQQAKIGLVGHIGIGHIHSHSGFVQDDSMGFAMLVRILQECKYFNTIIEKINVVDDCIEIWLQSGGIGKANVARGICFCDKELLHRAEQKSFLSPQFLSSYLFGKIYGQGISEVATAVSLAYAKAILDTIRKIWPETIYDKDNVPSSAGEFLGGNLSIDGTVIAWLLTINASNGGLAPNEDAEGNVPIGNKGILMQKLGLTTLPTIIFESKAYIPSQKNLVFTDCFNVRWNKESDNNIVGKALIEALSSLNLPYVYSDIAYPRNDDSLEKEVFRVADKIIMLGEQYKKSQTSEERIKLAHALAIVVSEELGGSIFMSNKIFKLFAGGGILPGLCAVLSYCSSQETMQKEGQVIYTQEEVEQVLAIVPNAITYIMDNYTMALTEIQTKKINHSPEELLQMIS